METFEAFDLKQSKSSKLSRKSSSWKNKAASEDECESDNEVQRLCLICSKDCGPQPIPQMLGGGFCLNRHLYTMFILRKLLQFPAEECENLLWVLGSDPGDWSCSLCSSCNEIVQDGLKTHYEILSLENEMSGLSLKLKSRLKDSLEAEGGITGRVSVDARCVVRDYFRGNIRGERWHRSANPNLPVTENFKQVKETHNGVANGTFSPNGHHISNGSRWHDSKLNGNSNATP